MALINLGSTSDNTSVQTNSTDRKYVSGVVPSSSGRVATGVARVFLSAAGTSNARLVIYKGASIDTSTLIATSDQVAITNTTEAAISFTFSGLQRAYLTSGQQYYIGIHFSDPGTPNFTISRANTIGTVFSNSDTYSDGASAVFAGEQATTTSNGPLDIYVTYDDTILPTDPMPVEVTGTSATFTPNATGANTVSLTVPTLVYGLLLVPLFSQSGSITSVTFNGIALTSAGVAASGFEYFYLVNPPAGTFNLVVNRASTVVAATVIAYYLSYVNQTSPMGARNAYSSISGASMTKSVTKAANSMILAFEKHQTGLGGTVSGTLTATPSGGTVATAYGSSSGSPANNFYFLKTAAGATSYGWNSTNSGDSIFLDVAEVKGYSAPTATGNMLMMFM